jgi:fatty aldehyde-generating acyl-ACP reductase
MDRFGFLAHPINRDSFYDCIGPWRVFKGILPDRALKEIAMRLGPNLLCSFDRITSAQGAAITGDIVTLRLLPMQIAAIREERALKAIESCLSICEKRGARIVGLGGFTSVVGDEGRVLQDRSHVPLTSGNTLTAALALEGIYKAAYLMDMSLSQATAAVIGATGDIGSICTKVLSKNVKKVNIAARNEKRLNEFAEVVRRYGQAEVEVFKYTRDAVKDADIVLAATSAVTTVIEPANLKSGAVVCDVAIPANIAKEVARERDDILVFEGGLAKIAKPEELFHARLASAFPMNSVFGCLAETMALTFEKRFEQFSIGRGNITEEKMSEIKAIAKRHGITLSDFFCGYRFFTEQDISNIRKSAERKKGNMETANVN